MITRLTRPYSQLNQITSGPISDSEWNQLTDNNRYLHETGVLSGSSGGIRDQYITSRNTTDEKFFPVMLFRGYRLGMFSIRFKLLKYSDGTLFQSEVLTVRIYRAGNFQDIAKFYLSPTNTTVEGGYPITTTLTTEEFVLFELNPDIMPSHPNVEIGRIGIRHATPNFVRAYPPAATSGVNSFHFQTFSSCP